MVIALLMAMAPLAQAAPYAYVSNETDGTVTVIDTASDTVVTTIPVGSVPFGVAVSPDGSQVYIANRCQYADYCGAGSVSVIDTTSDQVVNTVAPQTYPSPSGMAVSPDGSRIYVANDGGDEVSVIDALTDAVIQFINVGYGPRGLAASPDGRRLYVANQCARNNCSVGGTLSILNTASDPVKLIDTIALDAAPAGVAVSPDGTRVYVTNEYSGSVSVIHTATQKVVATVPAGNGPLGIAVSPDGTRVYVADWYSNTVSVIDAATDQLTGTITVGTWPTSVSLSPDGTRLYVANDSSDNVSVVNTATDQVVATIPVGTAPFPIGSFVGPGVLIAPYSTIHGPAGTQLSGTLPALGNSTPCTTTDTLINEPNHGQLDFDSSTGQYTYTPDSTTYSGPDTFVWRGEAPTSCTTADNPTKPLSRPVAVSLTLDPVVTGLGDTTVNENHSTYEKFGLTGSPPFTYTVTSSYGKLLPTSGLTVTPTKCGVDNADLTCTLTITPTLHRAGHGTVTLTAVDAYGDSTKEQIDVSVASTDQGGGGGGAYSPVGLMGLLALLVIADLSRRRLQLILS